jgi:hydrogenase nickel incorporation protein HypB
MFRHADLVLVTKADLLPVLDDFEVSKVVDAVRALGNPAPVMTVSARSGEGLPAWLAWLQAQRVVPADLADKGGTVLASSR